jgi:hypothetical protein
MSRVPDRFRPLWGLVFFVALLASALACSPSLQVNPNSNSGMDGERGRARVMPLNQAVVDNVDYTANDMTDWKYFQIPGPGRVTIRLGCDNPGAACIVNIRDEMGAVIRRLPGGEGPVQETLSLNRGNYYLEIYAQASATAYTVLVEYEPN